MSKQKSLKKNIILNIILTASNFVFPLITYSYTARILTPVGTGKVAFVNSVLSYFSYIAILGIPIYGLRECSKMRDNKEEFSLIVKELMIINIVSTIVAYILLILFVVLVPKLYSYKNLFLIMGIYILMNTIGLEWVYKSLEEYAYITIRSLIFKSISVVLTFFLINDTDDYLLYGFLTVFTISANYLCNFINVHKHISLKSTRKCQLKRHLKPIIILFASTIIIQIYAEFDIVMIGFIRTENEVGLYSTALKIKNIVLSVSTAITSIMIPRISYFFEYHKREEIKSLLLISIRLSCLLALPLAVYIFFFSQNILIFLCGSDYLNATYILKILMLSIIPLIITNIFGNQILIPFGMEKRYTQSVFIGLFINLILNIIMIPTLGAFGAAIGTFVTECWNVIWMSNGIKEYRIFLMKSTKIAKYLLALIIGIIGAVVISKTCINLSIMSQLFITSFVFFGLYYTLLLIIGEPVLSSQLKKFFKYINP